MVRSIFLVFAYLVAMGMAIDSFGAEPSELPSFSLSRHFPAGGYEGLSLQCRADRTREDGRVCELKRTRNGLEVSQVTLEYRWASEKLGHFVRQVSSLSGAEGGGSNVLLAYDGWSNGKRVQGFIRRGEPASPDEAHAKAVLALEGALVSQFYR